jgi:TP901 family phage tail tape measure protein
MAETASKHNLFVRVMGAVKAAQKNKMVAQSIKSMTTATRQLRAGLLGMRGMMTGAAASLVAMGLALRKVVGDYAKYTDAQSQLRTALAANTDQGARNARMFAGPLAEAVGRDFGYSLSESNEAMATMIQTGIGVHKSMRVFRSSMRLARVADMDTAQATRFLVDTMNMFNREVMDGDGTVQGFADRMSGQLAVAAYSTSTNIEDLQQAFRYAGTELSGLGYNSRQVMSALAGLSVVGLRSTTAGTRLRGAMMAMHRTTGPLTALLKKHGIASEEVGQAWYNADGSLKPFYDGLDNMSGLIRRVSSQQDRNAIQMHLFGRRAFAAGQFVTGMSQAAVRARRAFDEMGEGVEETLAAMEEERMRSFSMQMTQLQEAASDLAIGFGQILFGEMQQGEKGFGTYMREVSEGVMLIGQLNTGNAIAEQRWAALAPEVQEAAQEFRSLFMDLSAGLKIAWGMLKWVGRFTRQHPYLVAGIILLRISFGGLYNSIMLAVNGMTAFGSKMPLFHGQMGPATRGATMLRGALGLLAIHLIGTGTAALQAHRLEMEGMTHEFDQIQSSASSANAEIARGIPIVGNLVAQYIELMNVMIAAWEASTDKTARRGAEYGHQYSATAQQRILSATATMGRSESTRGMSGDELEARATRAEHSRSIQRTAQMYLAQGIQSRQDIQNNLMRHGNIQGEYLQQMTERIMSRQSGMSETDVQNARDVAGVGLITGRDGIQKGVVDTTRQLGGFEHAAAGAMGTLQAIADWDVDAALAGPQVQSNMPDLAEDAYVNRGGLMGVSSGDLVVSRRHLANAVTARRGALAGPAVGMSGSDGMIGPQPSSSGGGGEIAVTVPVSIDGREIARAVGRASVQQLERGGGNIAPGERRSLRETGFRRNV